MNPEICRFCLKFNNLHSFFPISDELKDDFENLTNIELQLLPEHPKSICEFCLRFMQAVTAYKYQLIENQRDFYVDMEVKAVFDLKIDNNIENREIKHKEMSKSKELEIISVESIGNMESLDHPASIFKPKNVNKTLSCNICGQVFSKNYKLKRHLIMYESKNDIYECEECGKKFHTKSGIKRHTTIGHTKGSKKCLKCTKIFYTDKGLAEHMKILHDNKRYFCTYPSCHKMFSWLSDCRKHIRCCHTSVKDIKSFMKIDSVEVEEL